MFVWPPVPLVKTRPDFGSIVTLPSRRVPSFSFKRQGTGAAAAENTDPKITKTKHHFTSSVFPENCHGAKSKLLAWAIYLSGVALGEEHAVGRGIERSQ